jgi:hypothetical protein
MKKRVIYATLVLGGVLLLATASLRFDVVDIKPNNAQPFILKRIVWPWQGNDIPGLQTLGSYSYHGRRFSFWGLREESRRGSCVRSVCGVRTPAPVAELSNAADSR